MPPKKRKRPIPPPPWPRRRCLASTDQNKFRPLTMEETLRGFQPSRVGDPVGLPGVDEDQDPGVVAKEESGVSDQEIPGVSGVVADKKEPGFGAEEKKNVLPVPGTDSEYDSEDDQVAVTESPVPDSPVGLQPGLPESPVLCSPPPLRYLPRSCRDRRREAAESPYNSQSQPSQSDRSDTDLDESDEEWNPRRDPSEHRGAPTLQSGKIMFCYSCISCDKSGMLWSLHGTPRRGFLYACTRVHVQYTRRVLYGAPPPP